MRRALGLSVGLIGVQVVWGLQNVGTTRIFQTLGASAAELPILWIAAPVTGLLVQPVVGWLSDRAHLGTPRRLPYLAVGAAATAAAMIVMAEARVLWLAIVALWLLTASVNVTMQPLRALLADALPPERRAAGYAIQVIFIGVGAVFASVLPWLLARWGGLAGVAEGGGLPPTIRVAFRVGAAVLLVGVAWTIVAARRAPLVARRPHGAVARTAETRVAGPSRSGSAWIIVGLAIGAGAWAAGLRREVYLLVAIAIAYGLLARLVAGRQRHGQAVTGPLEIVADIAAMPLAMRRLAVTQFFTWFSMFAMWVYAVPAIAARAYDAAVPGSAGYARAADHVGILFAVGDASSAVAALALPPLFARLGLRGSYAACLALSAGGMVALASLREPALLWLPMIATGAGWAAIMSIPYTLVANSVPSARLGEYMGVHNIFLVLPQLAGACVLGIVLERVFAGDPVAMLWVAAGSLAVAAASVARIPFDPATRGG